MCSFNPSQMFVLFQPFLDICTLSILSRYLYSFNSFQIYVIFQFFLDKCTLSTLPRYLHSFNAFQIYMLFQPNSQIYVLFQLLYVLLKVISNAKRIEYIYIRVEFRLSLGMSFFSPFQPEKEFKVYKSCKCSQMICSRVHKYSMFPRPFISISKFLKLLNKLYNELGE